MTLDLLEQEEHATMPHLFETRSMISGAVTIVIEGGVDTIRLIHYDLSHHLPVIIVEVSSSSSRHVDSTLGVSLVQRTDRRLHGSMVDDDAKDGRR